MERLSTVCYLMLALVVCACGVLARTGSQATNQSTTKVADRFSLVEPGAVRLQGLLGERCRKNERAVAHQKRGRVARRIPAPAWQASVGWRTRWQMAARRDARLGLHGRCRAAREARSRGL